MNPQLPTPLDRDVYQSSRENLQNYRESRLSHGAPRTLLSAIDDTFNGIDASRSKIVAEMRSASNTAEKSALQFEFITHDFLPRLYALLNKYSRQDLMSSPEALNKLDNFLVPGRMQGWTKQFLQTVKDGSSSSDGSDQIVTERMKSINDYLDKGQNAPAKSESERLLNIIDNGQAKASREDYEMLNRIAHS